MHRIQKILTLALALPLVGVASDWPNFRGSNYDGNSDEKLPNRDWKNKPPKEIWRITLGDNGYAGPSVAAGKLFIIDHKDTRDVIRAVDVKTGTKIWSFDYDDTDKEQGGYGFAHATPAYDSGRIYTLSALGVLHCLKADDGTLVWKCDIKTKYGGRFRGTNWGYAGSPLVDGDKVIVCPGGSDASVVALNKNTGDEIWKGAGDPPGYATPVKAMIGGKAQYVIFSGVNLMGLDAESGKSVWSFPWHTDYDVNAATPVVVANTVFITSDYGKGCALIDGSASPAAELWKNKALKSHFNTPIFFEDHFYGIGKPGELSCIVQKTGDMKWKAPGFQDGGLMGIDGLIIAINGSDGDVVLCKASSEKYEELGRIKPLNGRSWTAPIVANGKLYVRNQTVLVCLELNPTAPASPAK